eukprot:scaffold1954_cov268-Pinguiococcus_pyrenoidosus.AAC.32
MSPAASTPLPLHSTSDVPVLTSSPGGSLSSCSRCGGGSHPRNSGHSPAWPGLEQAWPARPPWHSAQRIPEEPPAPSAWNGGPRRREGSCEGLQAATLSGQLTAERSWRSDLGAAPVRQKPSARESLHSSKTAHVEGFMTATSYSADGQKLRREDLPLETALLSGNVSIA